MIIDDLRNILYNLCRAVCTAILLNHALSKPLEALEPVYKASLAS